MLTGELIYKSGYGNVGHDLAAEVARKSDQDNFYDANVFMDFKEYLSDHYLEGGAEEFRSLWHKFQEWQQLIN